MIGALRACLARALPGASTAPNYIGRDPARLVAATFIRSKVLGCAAWSRAESAAARHETTLLARVHGIAKCSRLGGASPRFTLNSHVQPVARAPEVESLVATSHHYSPRS